MLLSSQGHEQKIYVFKDVQRFAMHRDAMIIHDPSSTERQLVVSAARYFHSYPGRKYPGNCKLPASWVEHVSQGRSPHVTYIQYHSMMCILGTHTQYVKLIGASKFSFVRVATKVRPIEAYGHH